MPDVARAARAITHALGLTMSVHDFLDTASGPVFLEANPQGSWLFLKDADERVVPKLAEHLRSAMGEQQGGTWPSLHARVLNDFKTKTRAPSTDGVVAPTYESPPWIKEVAKVSGAVEVARRANDDAKDSARVAEEKAARLVQVALALMTVSLALGAFQLQFALDRSALWLLTLLPIAFAMLCLVLSAVEALQLDRVGFYQTAQLGDLVQTGAETDVAIIDVEERGRTLARWTARNKHTDLMQARAWFSRGLVALIIAAMFGAGLRAGAEFTSQGQTRTTTSTTTVANNSP
jgi:hypothetical protein